MAGRDLTTLFANPRMIPSAIAPFFATAGVDISGVPVVWAWAFMPACVVAAILTIGFVRQGALKKPAKVWRGSPWLTFTFNIAAVVASLVGTLYATRPWIPAFEVEAAFAMGVGYGVAGAAVVFAMSPVWFAQMKRNDGPMKKAANTVLFWVGIVLYGLMLGPVAGYFGSLPLTFLYIEEVASSNPAWLSREGWLLLLTLLLSAPCAAIWAYVDLRRHLAKQRRG